KPKPMVTIGGKPILWHIMKGYAHYGYREFVLALGYKGWMIKEYFLNEKNFTTDFTLKTAGDSIEYHGNGQDDFIITFVDTGEDSLTGDRLLRVKSHLGNEPFMLTYGDGVSNIDIKKLVDFHHQQRTVATITGAHPHSKYGLVKMDQSTHLVTSFDQKPVLHDYVNSGFMVFQPEAFSYVQPDMIEESLRRMVSDKQLSIYEHDGFWKSMDTYAEMEDLNRMWAADRPWAVWQK
ncbi:MAG: glucose-1-phosphate cytidylyltransferase, partial [Candidatus Kerfeldbacteria bacterium]|nr:glucose-1-phosphate cytidylyltransferase [Candidatus Kerfeldbacteria bacterium]